MTVKINTRCHEQPNVNGVLKLTPTDHHTLILTLQNLPVKLSDKPTKKEIGWNFNKEGGWKTYEDITKDKCADLLNLFEHKSNCSVDNLVESFNKKHEKILYKSFGKVTQKFTKGKINNAELQNLQKQRIKGNTII